MLGDNIRKIRLDRKMGLNETARKADITGGYLSSIENNKRTNIGTDILQKIADALEVSVNDFFDNEEKILQEENIKLHNKDEKDIAKAIDNTLAKLETKQDGLMFDGEPIDDETRELLRISLENSMRLAKQMAKKYTPKKYKK